jgi:hypothetical protein
MNRDKKIFRHRRREFVEDSRLVDAVVDVATVEEAAALRLALLRAARRQAIRLRGLLGGDDADLRRRGRPTALSRLRELRRRGKL